MGAPHQDLTDPLSLATPRCSPRVGCPSPGAQPTPRWLLLPEAGEVPDLKPGAGGAVVARGQVQPRRAGGTGSGYGLVQK